MVDVEEFVGVKSCKAKGKRLTTFDVATLTFIEPEIVEQEKPESNDEPIDDDAEPMVEPLDEVVEEVVEEEIEVVKPVNNSGTPIEIIRNDIDDTNTEQLNLF
jgi:topoisomerase-4 subunit A